MSSVSPLETSQGYAPPSVTQFSVFLDNRVGKLYEVLQTFDRHPVCQVCAIITNDCKSAKQILQEHRLAFSEMDVLVVELTGGQSLSRMCLYLLGAELNIRFSYPVMLRPNGTPTIALAVDDATLAGQILRRKNFNLLGEQDLPKPDPDGC